MSHRAAAAWDGEEFRPRGQRLRLQSIGAQVPGVSSPALLARNYAIRIMETENLHAVQLVQLLEDIARVPVRDVRFPGLTGRSHPDNDYWTVIFDARSCPLELSGASVIRVGDENLTLHHFQRHQQPPCWRCLNPHHMESRLSGPMHAGQAAQWTFRAEIFIGRPSADRGVLRAVTVDPVPVSTSAAFSGRRLSTDTTATTDASGMAVVRRRRSRAGGKVATGRQHASANPAADPTTPAQSSSHPQTGGAELARSEGSGATEGVRTPTQHGAQPLSAAERKYRDTCAAYRTLAVDSDTDSDAEDVNGTNEPQLTHIAEAHEGDL
ncbi:hypothetical protein PF002_g10078 [Phytophthora fragariae]|uniref:Uncharacterized protein n=2 Tax=Phytophthora fragariae TaxID=53985 RepID=A0A6A3ZPH8_9STRA|nr:hypothetical protein PF002_g10078 [Phytophthora fragariae]KAE9314820.1 hypothetical protein PF001_g8082 [Phytophthora fragariae]